MRRGRPEIKMILEGFSKATSDKCCKLDLRDWHRFLSMMAITSYNELLTARNLIDQCRM